LVRQK